MASKTRAAINAAAERARVACRVYPRNDEHAATVVQPRWLLKDRYDPSWEVEARIRDPETGGLRTMRYRVELYWHGQYLGVAHMDGRWAVDSRRGHRYFIEGREPETEAEALDLAAWWVGQAEQLEWVRLAAERENTYRDSITHHELVVRQAVRKHAAFEAALTANLPTIPKCAICGRRSFDTNEIVFGSNLGHCRVGWGCLKPKEESRG